MSDPPKSNPPPNRFDQLQKSLNSNPGFKEDEFGELKSTITPLSKAEIIERVSAKAQQELQEQADQEVFAVIDQALQALQNEQTEK